METAVKSSNNRCILCKIQPKDSIYFLWKLKKLMGTRWVPINFYFVL